MSVTMVTSKVSSPKTGKVSSLRTGGGMAGQKFKGERKGILKQDATCMGT